MKADDEKSEKDDDYEKKSEENIQDDENLDFDEDEIARQEILAETETNRGKQGELPLLDEFPSPEELKNTILEDIDYDNIDDPLKKWRLYYTCRNLINKNVEYGKLRDEINDEKNLFLNEGNIVENGVRGSDGRMAPISAHNKVLEIIIDWRISGNGGVALLSKFQRMNDEYGYH